MIYLYVTDVVTTYISSGAVQAQKFWGWGGALLPSACSSPSPFSPFSETKKRTSYIGLHVKSIISKVAIGLCNGLEPQTRKNEA